MVLDVRQLRPLPEGALCGRGYVTVAIVALAKAFSDRGITDGVQVNSVLPGPVMTGRRRSYLQHWAPLHDMTVEEATANFPKEAGIARYGEPEEIAELMAFLVSPGALWRPAGPGEMDGGEVKSISRGRTVQNGGGIMRNVSVMPAKAGIQTWPRVPRFWIPAFAGLDTTLKDSHFERHARPSHSSCTGATSSRPSTTSRGEVAGISWLPAMYGWTIFAGSTTRSNSASVTKPSFNAASFRVRSLSIA